MNFAKMQKKVKGDISLILDAWEKWPSLVEYHCVHKNTQVVAGQKDLLTWMNWEIYCKEFLGQFDNVKN